MLIYICVFLNLFSWNTFWFETKLSKKFVLTDGSTFEWITLLIAWGAGIWYPRKIMFISPPPLQPVGLALLGSRVFVFPFVWDLQLLRLTETSRRLVWMGLRRGVRSWHQPVDLVQPVVSLELFVTLLLRCGGHPPWPLVRCPPVALFV